MTNYFERFNNIIWDWNGTLLDDLWLGVDVLNCMLQRRGITGVNTREYLNLFDFPVVDYYKKVGFDFKKESFEDIAAEYVELYYWRVNECILRSGIKEALEKLSKQGKLQIILSATEHSALNRVVSDFGISKYFSSIRGIKNHYAESKVDIGKQLIKELNIKTSEVLIIGDTTHDVQVADELGATCILITGGHQSREKLQTTGAKVIESIWKAI